MASGSTAGSAVMKRSDSTPLESLLRRDRAVVLAGLTTITLLAWVHTVRLAAAYSHGGSTFGMALGHPNLRSWEVADLALLFVMWTVMMVAMMMPSAAPMILTFVTISRQQQAARHPGSSTALFLLGYGIVWTGFSALAAIAEWGLHSATLLSSAGASVSPVFSGILLVVAGLFQWSRLKYACLAHCRSPVAFLMGDWRDGGSGALKMGISHGIFCVGCCWALMALMFLAGVMNLLWLATIALFVLLEKVAPRGHLISHLAGVCFVGWGLVLLFVG